MHLPFSKTSSLDRQLKKIRRELSSVDKDLRTIHRSKTPAGLAPTAPGDMPMAKGAGDSRAGGARRSQTDLRDERFAEYFANHFQTTRPLARERKVQRNKAIVMVVFVLAVLALVAYRLAILWS